jgi:hypothetical protein
VAVKVQRPGIRAVVERDLDIVARLARTLERRTRWTRSIGAGDLAQGFADAVREELDFRIEAGNMAAVAAAGPGGDGAVAVPVPHGPLCTQRVLVMQRLEGTPLDAADRRIAERALDRQALSVPPEVAAVFRALATLVGTLARLAPGFNLVTEARSTAGCAILALRVRVLIFRPDR